VLPNFVALVCRIVSSPAAGTLVCCTSLNAHPPRTPCPSSCKPFALPCPYVVELAPARRTAHHTCCLFAGSSCMGCLCPSCTGHLPFMHAYLVTFAVFLSCGGAFTRRAPTRVARALHARTTRPKQRDKGEAGKRAARTFTNPTSGHNLAFFDMGSFS